MNNRKSPPGERHDNKDHAVLDAWQGNADAWVETVREGRIPSRRVTDSAILDAILQASPQRVLDIGCGEGWLCRALAARGIEAWGCDGIEALVSAARRHSHQAGPAAVPPAYVTGTYDELPTLLADERFDVIVANFSLLDQNPVERLLGSLPGMLKPSACVLVQTLHPVVISTPETYRDGWRLESWSGMGTAFKGSAPWYFRTLESWQALFAASGLQLMSTLEPLNPQTGQPASILFQALSQ